MKTQINSLVRGDHRLGIVGTSHEVREAVASKVRAENPEFLRVLLRGREIELTANWSVSGRSVFYLAAIDLDLYRMFFGDFGLQMKSPEASIIVFDDCTVVFSTNSRKSFYNYIPESEITIL